LEREVLYCRRRPRKVKGWKISEGDEKREGAGKCREVGKGKISTHEGELKFESRVGVLNDDGSERLTNSMLRSLVVVIVGEVIRIEIGGSLTTSSGKSELGSLIVSDWRKRREDELSVSLASRPSPGKEGGG